MSAPAARRRRPRGAAGPRFAPGSGPPGRAARWACGRDGAGRAAPPAPPVVGGDPGLDGAAADAQGAGDLGCGIALLGQDDGLHAGPGAGVAVSPGCLLQAVQRVMILDMHQRMSLSFRVRKTSSGNTKHRMIGSAAFHLCSVLELGRTRPSYGWLGKKPGKIGITSIKNCVSIFSACCSLCPAAIGMETLIKLPSVRPFRMPLSI